MAKTALIGYSGFVGSNLARSQDFDEQYRSSDIDGIRGQRFDLVACAGVRAEKWKINQDPESDRADLKRLTDALETVEVDRFVQISTIDVYPAPKDVDERTEIDRSALHPYGLHRLELEDFVRGQFPNALVVRLPALFGPGLKKNVIYDFLTDNREYFPKIHADNTFQYFGLSHLWDVITRALEHDIKLLNVATEPMSVAELARGAFGFEFDNRPADLAPRSENFRTIHAEALGGADGYLQAKADVLDEIKRFVQDWKAGKR